MQQNNIDDKSFEKINNKKALMEHVVTVICLLSEIY